MIHSTSNNSLPKAGAVTPADSRPSSKAAPAAVNRDTLDTTASATLREALAAQPEIRPEVVEKGKQLLVDASYPPRAIIEDIARLFVNTQDLSNQE